MDDLPAIRQGGLFKGMDLILQCIIFRHDMGGILVIVSDERRNFLSARGRSVSGDGAIPLM